MPSRREETWYRLSADETLDKLDARREGLSKEQAASRLDKHGPNTIRSDQGVSAWKVLLDQFTSPLIYVLLVALVVTLVIQHWADAIVIGVVLLINGTIGFFQEFRAEKAVRSLMKMVSPKATVRRDGQEQEVESDHLVPGDIVILSEGDMIPTDLRLIESKSLQVNESALTGESVPVSKSSEAMENADEDLPPADQENVAFMGTAVTSGRGEGVIVATGQDTQLGEIARGVREAGETQTPLQRRMDRMAKWITAAVVLSALISSGVGWWMGRSVEEMLLLAVSLAVGAIPEGLPVVMTVALAVGVRRMARRHAVIRHLPAVETLGSTTVIVSDKTGTLTQNRMTVQEIFAGDSRYRVSGEAFSRDGRIERDGEPVDVSENAPLFETLLAGLLNNSAALKPPDKHARSGENEERAENTREQPNPQNQAAEQSEEEQDEAPQADQQELQAKGDPMEVAMLVVATKAGLSREDLLQQYPQTDEVPFQTEKQFSATIHDVPEDQDGPLTLIKGAPERLLEMCDRRKKDDGEKVDLDRDAIKQQNEEFASQGLRVLAMAVGRGQDAAESIKSENPAGMTLVGMQGLLDPPRPEAIEAVDDCHRAGIRVVMVTGDHARTAAAIAHQVHLDQPVADGKHRDATSTEDRQSQAAQKESPEAHTGQQLADLSDDEVDSLLQRSRVFARVKPDHKVRIVDRLKAQDHVVAVTGDGVNDAPALKSAHLGAAMGQTGTDVAKEASDMVITDDNFASIYAAVEEGRTAFRNIRMATFFLLSTGVANVFIILFALGMDWPLPLLPAQILWLNVVANGIADAALGFEPGEKALFLRPPRPPSEGILNGVLIERLVILGLWMTFCSLAVFYWIYTRGDNIESARVAALTTLVLFQMVHVFNCRSEDVSIFKKSLLTNKVLLIGVLASLGVHIAALYIPWTQQLLEFQPLSWKIWIVAICLAATAIVVNEGHKYFRPPDAVGPQTRLSRSKSRSNSEHE